MTDVVSTADGRRLEVLTGGADDGFPFLFHSGTPSAAFESAPLWNAARDARLRLVTHSRPGYGLSTPWPDEAEPVLADDVADSMTVLDALGIDDFVTLGWSGGGPRALACAALRPDRCRAVVSLAGVGPDGMDDLDFTAGMGPENVRDFELCRQGREAYRARAEADAATLGTVDGSQIAAALGGLIDDVDRSALTGEFADNVASTFRHAFSQGAAGYLADSLQAVRPWGFDLASITVPVSIWQGAHDRMVPFTHGQWLARAVPGARKHLYDDEGHLSLVTRIPEMLAELREMAGLP